MKIKYSSSQGLHTASYGPHSVGIESSTKRIGKKDKEYLAKCLAELVEFRKEAGKHRGCRFEQ